MSNNSEFIAEDEKLISKVPQHIAIIMDGNGRWAKKRGLPRIAGHKEGMNNVKTIAIAANNLGVKILTLYAFSTENWGRPSTEVNFLMKLPIDFFGVFMPELMKNNIRVVATGLIEKVPEKTRNIIQKAVENTKNNTGMKLNFAFNYGGRADIIEATKNIAQKVIESQMTIDEINDESFNENLLTSDLKELADPDLLIRTSGEMRISNFMLWQLAYTEMVFNDIFWPDYSPADFKKDILEYENRNRRFGKLK